MKVPKQQREEEEKACPREIVGHAFSYSDKVRGIMQAIQFCPWHQRLPNQLKGVDGSSHLLLPRLY